MMPKTGICQSRFLLPKKLMPKSLERKITGKLGPVLINTNKFKKIDITKLIPNNSHLFCDIFFICAVTGI